MKHKKRGLSIFLTLIIVLTASMTTCAATGTEHSIVLRNHADTVKPAPHYKYTFQSILV